MLLPLSGIGIGRGGEVTSLRHNAERRRCSTEQQRRRVTRVSVGGGSGSGSGCFGRHRTTRARDTKREESVPAVCLSKMGYNYLAGSARGILSARIKVSFQSRALLLLDKGALGRKALVQTRRSLLEGVVRRAQCNEYVHRGFFDSGQ